MSKILYVVPNLDEVGGIQNFAVNIHTALKEDFDIELINWKRRSWNLPTKVMLETNLFFSPILNGGFKVIKEKVRGADLVHFWYPDIARPFIDTRNYIISCHGKELLSTNMSYFQRRDYQKIFKRAKAVHVNSNYTKNLVLDLFDVPEEKIRVINPPIDYNKFKKFALKNRNTGKNDKYIVGTLTRFVRRKNIPNTIKALNILKERYDLNFEYYIAGDGIDKKRIMDELQKAKFEWKYFGEISEEKKIKEFYPSLDVFIMPTLDLPNDIEGFGIVYLEANAFGIPVIASKTGGVPEAVKEGVSGEFADPTNAEEIAEKIMSLAERKNELREKCKNHARKFDVKRISKHFEELYENVMLYG